MATLNHDDVDQLHYQYVQIDSKLKAQSWALGLVHEDVKTIKGDVAELKGDVAELKTTQGEHGQMLHEHGRMLREILDRLGPAAP